MWEEFILHACLGVLQVVIKNPTKAAALKGVLLHIRDAIDGIYPKEI